MKKTLTILTVVAFTAGILGTTFNSNNFAFAMEDEIIADHDAYEAENGEIVADHDAYEAENNQNNDAEDCDCEEEHEVIIEGENDHEVIIEGEDAEEEIEEWEGVSTNPPVVDLLVAEMPKTEEKMAEMKAEEISMAKSEKMAEKMPAMMMAPNTGVEKSNFAPAAAIFAIFSVLSIAVVLKK